MTPHAVSPALPGAPTSPVAARVQAWLGRGVDPASLAAFRILFGLLVAAGAARFLLTGFLDKLYCADAFYFRYPGLEWLPVPAPATITAIYVVFIGLGALIALGLFYRVAMALFVALFVWVQLIDLTNYLNHYVLVVLLGAIMICAPANACFSLDARWFGARRTSVPFFFIALLRFQVACVYIFAALAKAGPDWLLYGQPLGMWLRAKDELPGIGWLLALPWVPLVVSWVGFLYDASIVPLLSWRRTRPLAYLLVLVFHGMTSVFFSIGMFPYIMSSATTLFFDPSWPRRFLRAPTPNTHDAQPLPRPAILIALGWVLFSVFFPLRCHLIGDNVMWDEAGMRWSWRVMVREKSGTLEYRVTKADGRVVVISPHDLLTHRQVNEMIGQPDMILRLAHKIRDDHRARGEQVQVRADARVSLNGRPLAPFVDPAVDLAKENDSFGRPRWVLPAPDGPPLSSWRR